MATSTTKYTRMDLEAIYGGTAVKCWSGEWQEGDAPDYETFREGVSLDQALMALEDSGWTVHMFIDRKTGIHSGRALRGEIIRVDFRMLGQELVIQSFPYGWQAWTKPICESRWPADQLEAQIQMYREKGWTVRTWPSGARAWKGEVLPVRDAGTIIRMRERIIQGTRTGLYSNNEKNFDFAFDL